MAKLHFEDFEPGAVEEYGPRLVTREEIIAFATEFDPQPFHIDEEAARTSMLGGLCASGWHTCCIMMRMIADGFVLNSASMGAPGIEEVKWLLPVWPNDTLTVRRTVLDKRVSRSRPEFGFVRVLMEVLNQDGRCVMTMVTPMMMRLRAPDLAQQGQEAAGG